MAQCAPDMTRGIKNASGVSCHISSSLQVIYHAIPPKCREDVIILSERLSVSIGSKASGGIPEGKVFLFEVGNLFQLIGNSAIEKNSSEKNNALSFSRNDGVDPSTLYEVLAPKIDSLRVGDACASLRAILGLLSQSLEECINSSASSVLYCDDEITLLARSIDDCLNSLFWMGTLNHQIIGSRCVEETIENSVYKYRLMRSKAAKDRPLPCPVTIPVRGKGNIKASVSSVVASEHPITGYNWESLEQSEYNEDKSMIKHVEAKLVDGMKNVDLDAKNINDSDSDNSSSSSSKLSNDSYDSDSSTASSSSSCTSSDSSIDSCERWKTNKVIRCKGLPQVLILQLNRSEYKEGRIQLIRDGIHVPFELNLDDCIDSERGATCRSNTYILVGAVVHKDKIDDRSNDEDEHGHYISYMKGETNNNDIDAEEIWKKIDDENVTAFIVGNNDSEPRTNLKIIPRNSLCAMFGGNTKTKCNCATLLMYRLK